MEGRDCNHKEYLRHREYTLGAFFAVEGAFNKLDTERIIISEKGVTTRSYMSTYMVDRKKDLRKMGIMSRTYAAILIVGK